MPESSTSLSQRYRFNPLAHALGRGKQGSVFDCEDLLLSRSLVVKVTPLVGGCSSAPPVEVCVLRRLHHPNCVYFEDYFEENNEGYIVLEYCPGESLLSFVSQRKAQHRFSESCAKTLMRQLLLALRHVHCDLGCVHGDVKPANVLVSEFEGLIGVKLVDFGLSSFCGTAEEQQRWLSGEDVLPEEGNPPAPVEWETTGTPAYMACEAVQSLVDASERGCSPSLLDLRENIQKTDVFSVGVIAYTILLGHPPFGEEACDLRQLQKNMARLRFPPALWEGVSAEAISFVRELLESEAAHRPTAAQALQHRWLL